MFNHQRAFFSRAPASSVSPFFYSSFAFGTLAGWLVFAHIPDLWATLGFLLIALCGLGADWLSQREVPPSS
jgi:drug/metabolite transporter (DMT)-like permease